MGDFTTDAREEVMSCRDPVMIALDGSDMEELVNSNSFSSDFRQIILNRQKS